MPKRRSPGTGTLHKRKSDGIWVGAITVPSDDGQQRRRWVSSKSRGEAARKMRELQLAVDAGIVSDSPNMTTGVWLDYWIEKIQGPNVDPETRKFYADTIRLHIKPAIGGVRLNRLTEPKVIAMLDGIEKTATRQRAWVVLRMALKAAVARRRIQFNVTDSIRKPKHLAKEGVAFDAATAKHIIATAFKTCDEPTAIRWATVFLTAARPPGEILGLRWNDEHGRPLVDLDAGTIELSWQIQQMKQGHGCPHEDGKPTCGRSRRCPQARYVLPDGFEYLPLYKSLALTRPKSDAGVRVIPLIKPLWLAFKRLREITPDNDHGLVWTTAGRPIQPRDYQTQWAKLLSDAEVPYVRPYTSRHTTNTLLQDAGVDEDTRMQISGHSSVAAHRAYIHVSQANTRKALENLSALMPGESR